MAAILPAFHEFGTNIAGSQAGRGVPLCHGSPRCARLRFTSVEEHPGRLALMRSRRGDLSGRRSGRFSTEVKRSEASHEGEK
jgi:hypothetical protein